MDTPLTDLQRAEELIKREMITMMHYDATQNPVQHSNKKLYTSTMVQAQSYLEQHPYMDFDKEEIIAVSIFLVSHFT